VGDDAVAGDSVEGFAEGDKEIARDIGVVGSDETITVSGGTVCSGDAVGHLGQGDGAFRAEDELFLMAQDFNGLTKEIVLVVGDVEGAGEGTLLERLVVGSADETHYSVCVSFWHSL